jgi:hypothetical protein
VVLGVFALNVLYIAIINETALGFYVGIHIGFSVFLLEFAEFGITRYT